MLAADRVVVPAAGQVGRDAGQADQGADAAGVLVEVAPAAVVGAPVLAAVVEAAAGSGRVHVVGDPVVPGGAGGRPDVVPVAAHWALVGAVVLVDVEVPQVLAAARGVHGAALGLVAVGAVVLAAVPGPLVDKAGVAVATAGTHAPPVLAVLTINAPVRTRIPVAAVGGGTGDGERGSLRVVTNGKPNPRARPDANEGDHGYHPDLMNGKPRGTEKTITPLTLTKTSHHPETSMTTTTATTEGTSVTRRPNQRQTTGGSFHHHHRKGANP